MSNDKDVKDVKDSEKKPNKGLEKMKLKRKKRYEKHDVLLEKMKENMEGIKAILKTFHSVEEDRVYRFYHSSFKVYWLQDVIKESNELFLKLSPHLEKGDPHRWEPLSPDFSQIVNEALAVGEFKMEYNRAWLKMTRPILEAFFHCKYFLEQMVKYGELEKAPNMLPSGWAALLELYRIR